MDAPLVQLNGVTKTFNGVVRALDDVGIVVNRNEIVGVVGENGAGKSTLMKILAGVFPPDKGEWYHNGSKISFPRNPKEAAKRGVSIVYQEKGVIPALMVYQYLFLGHEDRYSKYTKLLVKEMKEYADRLLKELHIECSINDYMYALPLSTQKMVEIARAILGLRLEHGDDTASVIILDEPTAPLTIEERQELFRSLLKMKKSTSFVFVSHIMHEVLEFTDRVYVLRDGRLVCEYDLAKEKLTEADMFKAIVGKDSLECEHGQVETRKAARSEVVLTARNLTRNGSYYDISFELHKGECIGIFGPAGSGKSEIIKTIAGLLDFDEGALLIKSREVKAKESPHARLKRGVGYFSGETEKQLVLNWPIRKNISLVNMEKILGRTGIINFRAEKRMTESIARRFKIKASNVNVECSSLSGGNKQKVSVGKWFEKTPAILLLEDPTIGIDVGARQDIYEATLEMKNNGVSLLLVSDDPKEYAALCDRVIFLAGGRFQKALATNEFKEAMAT